MTRSRLVVWGAAVVLVAGWAIGVSGQPPEGAASTLPGSTWRLVSAGEFDAQGAFAPFPEYGPKPSGYLMYDRTGHMCVSLANPTHPRWADAAKPTVEEKARSFDAFFGYCGRYEVREKEGRVLHLPEMGSYPHYIGSDEFRDFRLQGDQLVLSGVEKSPGATEAKRYEIKWERVR
jgi:hypothetical protein